jgi:Ca2+-binding EF-hand superfamily protein
LFTKVAFRNALAAGDVDAIWKKADANGDGVISREEEELQQFIYSSGLPSLDEKSVNMSFKYLDTFQRGYISFDEFKCFCASLQENYYGRSSGNMSVNEDIVDTPEFRRHEFPLTPVSPVINSYNGTVTFV